MNLSRAIVDFTLKNRALIISIWLVFLSIGTWGLTKLTVSSDNRVFYSENNKAFNELREFENKYLPNHNITFLLSSDVQDAPLEELIHAVSWLSEKAWTIENVIRVDSIDNYPTVADSSEDSFTLSTIVEASCESVSKCENLKRISTPSAGIDQRLISKDRKSLAVVLTLELDESDANQIQRIVDDTAKLKKEFGERFPTIQNHHTGGIPMMHAFGVAADQDSATLAPITLAVIFLITSWLTQSIRATLFLVASGASSAVITLGSAGHLGHVLNPATSIASILILTLVVTSAMHFVSSFLNDSQIYDRYIATINATKVNLRPILLATATSMAGFASLLSADAPPIGQLGAMACFGVFLGTLHIFSLGPIFMQFVPSKSKPSPAQIIALFASKIMLSKKQVALMLLGLIAIAAGLSKLSINDDFVKYFDSRFEFRSETDYVSERLSGPNHLELDVETTSDLGIFDPVYLRETNELVIFLREKAVVANVYSLVDIFREIEPLFEKSQFDASDEELAQFYLAFELSLRQGQSSTDFISTDQQSSRVSIILGDSDSSSIRDLMTSLENWDSGSDRIELTVTGENAPVANLTPTNFREMILGIGTTLLVAAILVAVVLGSWRLAILCLLCTIAPIVLGFGLWGWTLTEIGLASVVVLAITIGIVIDDAIHIISRYQEISESESEYSSPVEQTIRIAGGAIVSSSIALASGFAILTFSGFGVNAAMGACTALIVLAALAIDLFVLPWLLRLQAG